jgi:hypothetical protein
LLTAAFDTARPAHTRGVPSPFLRQNAPGNVGNICFVAGFSRIANQPS